MTLEDATSARPSRRRRTSESLQYERRLAKLRSERISSLFGLAGEPFSESRRSEEGLLAQRKRLLAGVVAAVAEQGYGNTTLTHVVGHARASRRTFYEHFANKQQCFLEAYQAYADALLADIADVTSAQTGHLNRLQAGVDAYVAGIFTDPVASRVFHLEIYAAGPEAFVLRRSTHVAWARMIRDELNAARTSAVELQALTRELQQEEAETLVGGVVDTVQSMFEPGAVADPLRLRRAALDIHIAMSLSPTTALRDLLNVL